MVSSVASQRGHLSPETLSVTLKKYIAAKDLCPKQQERLRLHVEKFCAWNDQRDMVPEWESDVDRRQSILSLARFATAGGTLMKAGGR